MSGAATAVGVGMGLTGTMATVGGMAALTVGTSLLQNLMAPKAAGAANVVMPGVPAPTPMAANPNDTLVAGARQQQISMAGQMTPQSTLMTGGTGSKSTLGGG